MRPFPLAAVALLSIAPAHAGYSLTIPLELQADFIDTRVAGDTEGASDVYVTIEPDLRVEATDWLAFNLGATIEPVLDPEDDHRLLEDHGLFVRNLNVEFTSGPLTLTLGKFGALFGIGYEEAPGVYGDTLNADVEVAERLGASVSWNFEGQNEARYSITAAAFKIDTSFLSESAFVRRGRAQGADGNPGNTDGLENYSLSFDSHDVFGQTGLRIHVGFLLLQHEDGEDHHFAEAIGARWAIELGDGSVFTPLVEYFHSDGATLPGSEELGDGDQYVVAVGGSYVAGPWNAALVYGRSSVDGGQVSALEERNDFVQISVGYVFENGVGIDLGYLSGETSLVGEGEDPGTDVQSIGLLFTYALSFGNI